MNLTSEMETGVATLHPYPAYNLGIDWLGDVPSHWDVRRLKTLCENVNDSNPAQHQWTSCIALENIESWTGKIINPDPEARFDSQMKQFQAGDVLFGRLRPYLAKVLRPESDGLCVSEFFVLRLRNGFLLSSYLERMLRTKPVIDAIDASKYGAKMPRANWQFVGNMQFPVPTLAEQAAIARYLDRADERIQRTISAKERLVELLTEQRQSVIHQAVTRGLDPNVRLKDSGVEWLGDVPEHWDVRRAKYFYGEVDERSTTGIEELMSVSHITGVTPRKSSVTMFLAESNIGYKVCRRGDIAINTMWAYMAALGVAWQEGLVSPSYGVYRPRSASTFNPRYVDPLLRTETYKAEYLRRSTGITSSRLRLYSDQFLGIPLLCPPATEQDNIVRYLDKATAAIDAAVANAERQIDLLGEYRTRLIADVVMGQVDVRRQPAG